ncbi:unnamed protein product [Schistosoma mattheei]|uniref:Proteasome activator PA28 C-terminal domain-containing protein n=1 Tax=Schistosoma mattheei TaxID=31246 RepID=A0A3P7Y9I5_9TREM|nr:unnamed protein product [Schistosoma mattheei]
MFSFRNSILFLYYASRGKLVGKVAKYPHIEDYRECIRDMDEKQAITMRYIIMEIRNHYVSVIYEKHISSSNFFQLENI